MFFDRHVRWRRRATLDDPSLIPRDSLGQHYQMEQGSSGTPDVNLKKYPRRLKSDGGKKLKITKEGY